MQISEKELVRAFREFVIGSGLVRESDSHFGPDDNERADLELALERKYWPEDAPDYLLLEAKSHHSKDSANTINKIFGQLLKETGKKQVDVTSRQSYCLGVLFPCEATEWTVNSKINRRIPGREYYRRGFKRIDQTVFSKFGELVNARYVLAFSITDQELLIYKWNDFYNNQEPVKIFGGQQGTLSDAGKQCG